MEEDDLFDGLNNRQSGKAQQSAPRQKKPAFDPSSLPDDDLFDGLRQPLKQSPVQATSQQQSASPVAPPQGPPIRSADPKAPIKERTWGETASEAVRNIPKSAVEEAQAIIHPFLNPSETLQSAKQLGVGLYSKAKGALGFEQDPEQKAKDEAAADAVGDFYAKRYGSMSGFKEALAESPVGVLGDAATVLTGGGALGARLPGVAGKVGQIAGGVGKAIDPINLAVQAPKYATKAAMSVANYPISMQSGVSRTSLQKALNSGFEKNPVFWEHYSGSVPPQDLINRVNTAIKDVAQQRSDNYIRDMAAVSGRNPQTLSYKLVDDALAEAYKMAYPQGFTFNDKSQKVLVFKDINDLVNKWKNEPKNLHTMVNFDQLKKDIRTYAYEHNLPPNSDIRRMVDQIAEAAKATIPDKKYAEIMENYQKATEELNDLSKTMTAKGRSSTDRISKILREQDKKSKGDLVKRLAEVDPDLPAAIAGVELHPWTPQGLRGNVSGTIASNMLFSGLPALAAHPGAIAGLAFSSPKVGGFTNYMAGRVLGAPARLYGKSPAMADLLAQQAKEQTIIQDEEKRRGRKSGGRISSHEVEADRLIMAAERAKKGIGQKTQSILEKPDEIVVQALKRANQALEA